jgi:iron complex outermembrane receptor protein
MSAAPVWSACSSLLATFAPAPNSSSADPVEIVVTGERIDRSLKETPSSVAVFTEDAIEQAGAGTVDDLLALIPNVNLSTDGLGPTIRGQDSTGVLRDLPAFLGGNRPRVTQSVDGRAIDYFQFVFGSTQLWDVRQVEVFRSPQSTTQGRNSIAGAIFITTNDPEYVWHGRTRVQHGSLHLWQGSAAVTGPIVDDQLAFRIAADLKRARPSSDIADNAVGASTDKDNFGLVRVKLLAEPKALSGLRLVTSYTHSRSYSPQIDGVKAPFRERRDPTATYGVYRAKTDSVTSLIDHEASNDLRLSATLSTGHARFQRFAPAGLGQHKTRVRDWSAEPRIDWRADDKLRLRGGLYLSRSDMHQRIDVSAVFLGIGDFDDRQTSRGIFGEAEYRPHPRLLLTAGVRHQQDHQDRAGTLGTPGAGTALDYERKFSALLPKISLGYDLTDRLTIGALVQRAYNPGGMTLDTATGELDTFEEETLWSYEGFLRGSAADGRLTFSANAFYNDIKDAQRPQRTIVTLPDGTELPVSQLDNAPKARSYGLEAEAGWRLTPRLRFHAALGLLRTRIKETVLPSDPSLGKEYQRAPRISGSAGFDWRPNDSFRLSGQVRHHGHYFSNDSNTAALQIDKATKIDGRAEYRRGPFTLFGYGRNLLDDFSMTFLYSPTSGTAADPREIGIGLEAQF